jgi:hypothetical protein
MADPLVAQWIYRAAEAPGRAIVLSLLTLFGCAHADTWSSYRRGWPTYLQSDLGWHGQTYRLDTTTYGEFQGSRGAKQRCSEYTMGAQTQRECWPRESDGC